MPKCDLALPGPRGILSGPRTVGPTSLLDSRGRPSVCPKRLCHPPSPSDLLSAGPGSVCTRLGASKAGFEIQGEKQPGESGQFAAPVVW